MYYQIFLKISGFHYQILKKICFVLPNIFKNFYFVLPNILKIPVLYCQIFFEKSVLYYQIFLKISFFITKYLIFLYYACHIFRPFLTLWVTLEKLDGVFLNTNLFQFLLLPPSKIQLLISASWYRTHSIYSQTRL